MNRKNTESGQYLAPLLGHLEEVCGPAVAVQSLILLALTPERKDIFY